MSSVTLFSRRHRRSLVEGQLDVLVTERLRGRLIRLLQHFNESWHYQPGPNDNWMERTDALSELPGDLLDVYGTEELTTRTGNVTRTVDHEGWLRYAAGEGVLDAVEQFVTYLPDERRAAFIGEINRVFGEEDSVWRMLDQQFVKLDSIFVHQQFVDRALQMLGAVRWEGAAQELLAAENDLSDHEGRRAVHHAGSSTESAMKAALEREDGTAADLARALREQGWFDALPEELRGGFADRVLGALPWMRNRLGGHGQGREPLPVPDTYARLAVGLSAVVNEFIAALAIERDPSLTVAHAEKSSGAPSPSPGADDDIPF